MLFSGLLPCLLFAWGSEPLKLREPWMAITLWALGGSHFPWEQPGYNLSLWTDVHQKPRLWHSSMGPFLFYLLF
jgi:hypothetical protein